MAALRNVFDSKDNIFAQSGFSYYDPVIKASATAWYINDYRRKIISMPYKDTDSPKIFALVVWLGESTKKERQQARKVAKINLQ